jgi:hypothetical protein
MPPSLLDAATRDSPREIPWGESPFLGSLDAGDWGTLNARHLGHHLSQFGV